MSGLIKSLQQPLVRPLVEPLVNLVPNPDLVGMVGWNTVAPYVVTVGRGKVRIERNGGGFADMLWTDDFYNEGVAGTKWQIGFVVHYLSHQGQFLTGATAYTFSTLGRHWVTHTSTMGFDRKLQFRASAATTAVIEISNITMRKIG